MRKAWTLLFLGIWITILPFTGFPYAWKDILVTLTGLGIIFFSYIVYKDYKKKGALNKNFDNFKENNNFEENKI